MEGETVAELSLGVGLGLSGGRNVSQSQCLDSIVRAMGLGLTSGLTHLEGNNWLFSRTKDLGGNYRVNATKKKMIEGCRIQG